MWKAKHVCVVGINLSERGGKKDFFKSKAKI